VIIFICSIQTVDNLVVITFVTLVTLLQQYIFFGGQRVSWGRKSYLKILIVENKFKISNLSNGG
jgi:hypothetical protein